VLTIVHGSDLHFGKPHSVEAAEAFEQTVRDADPDLLVLSGDFTQRAKVREYQEARAYLDRFQDIPTVVTPGNHDVPLYRVFERLFTPYRNYREFISPELDSVTRIPGATVVSLDSAAPRARIVNGIIRPAQLKFAESAFEAAAERDLRIVVLHHHIAPAPDYERDYPLPRGRRILNALHDMGVELVLSGHLHRAYIGNSLDVYPLESEDGGITIVHSGTTTSRRGRARERARNSCNIIRVSSTTLEVTHLLLMAEPRKFEPVSRHTFPRRFIPFLPSGD
jgi:3',5'-cyclic AMP phosphodiesterase CpdA